MFDSEILSEILDLHEKSFALLRWVKASLKRGTLSFSVVHRTTDSVDAAREWIERHLANLPADVRPRADRLPMFARLFVSFLTTSFRLKGTSVRRVSDCGCWCSYCSLIRAVGPTLELRTPNKKDYATARELKRIYLERTASELALEKSADAIQCVLAADELRRDLSLATWGTELIRRSEFASQGVAVMALWREFAWNGGSPRRQFILTANKILDAERKIVEALRATG